MDRFDPFGAFARIVPEKRLHDLIRLGAVALYAVMLVRRVREYPNFLLKPLWVAETLIYLVLIAAFLVRTRPIDRSRGVREVIVPLAGGLLPFFLLYSPPVLWAARSRPILLAVFWWMTASTALTVWGMWALRRSFSITVEARVMITGGPYRYVRHPIYLGEILAAAAVAFWRFSAANVVVFALFVLVQLARARWEEDKLAKNFPDYREYADRTWWPL